MGSQREGGIAWTDQTWNPVRGCTKVSPGCAHCYAETFAERFRGVPGHPYEQGFDLRLVPEKLTEPLKWKKPRRVFVNSMSDLFQDGVPDSYIDQVFAVMALAPQHTFQVLTKRAERMREYLSESVGRVAGSARAGCIQLAADKLIGDAGTAHQRFDRVGWPMKNVWLGVSVESQHFADERIPLLLQTPAAVRFISAEPLLGPVDVREWLARGSQCDCGIARGTMDGCEPRKKMIRCNMGLGRLSWVIVGGESGHGARLFEVGWARSIVHQCKAAGVACFVKQLGANVSDAAGSRDDMGARDVWPAGAQRARDGKWLPIIGSRKGGEPSEWPEDLRVREFPA